MTDTSMLSEGEWEISAGRRLRSIYTVTDRARDGTPTIRVLAHVFDNNDGRVDADANCIRAAKDLLMAAEAALTMLDTPEVDDADVSRVLALLSNAVHKAKGMKHGN